MDYDVIVIGAGASGLMAAISSAQNGAKTLLIDKNSKVGTKLLLTGGGRCNVTNSASIEHIIECIPRNGRFLRNVFSQFDNQDIIKFLQKNGVELKEEDNGRVFPKSDKSSTIVNTLFSLLIKYQVTLCLEKSVRDLVLKDENIAGVLLQDGKKIFAKCVIVATGGMSYPKTGSSGDGYRFAKNTFHKIESLFPTESPLISDDDFIKNKTLQGLSLQDVKLSVLNSKNKTVISHQLDMIFTHFGISGPAALRCSMFAGEEIKKNAKATVKLDALPDTNLNELIEKLKSIKKQEPNKLIKNAYKGVLPERYLIFLLEQAKIDPSKELAHLKDKEINNFAELIKGFKINIIKTWPLEKSFVTGGGVSLKQIDPKTMQSKIVKGLFFVGEVLDINGYTGGYNVTIAFSTGQVAGRNAAILSLQK